MAESDLTFIKVYNEVTGQAWSMFDGEVEAEDEFEKSVTTSIQKALSALWNSFKFPFRYKTMKLKTRKGITEYNAPAGNIIKKSVKGSKTFDVICNKNYLSYDPDIETYEEKEGEPEAFYKKGRKILIYPTPDANYDINIGYLSFNTACDDDGNSKANLEAEDDYIDIDEEYQDLFLKALMPLAMTYLIASEQDENFSQYKQQYDAAYKVLLDYCRGIEKDKIIGW